ncbi:MAG: methyltransferase domain-containing protein [Candidatus Hydrogenedentes bacterium]|nr:methyltransferase domain-containing protein [Candidatus Hydrogenedentota bacterium]
MGRVEPLDMSRMMVISKLIDYIPSRCKKVLCINITQFDLIENISENREVCLLFTAENEKWKEFNYPNKYFQKLGKDTLPFEDEIFDFVIGEEIFSHCLGLANTVSEIRRILKNQGLLLTVEPNIQYVDYFFDLVEGKWEDILQKISPNPCHYFFTIRSLSKMIMDSGFKVDACYPVELDNTGNFPRNSEGYIVRGKYLLGPINDSEYLEFLTKRYIVLSSKLG